MAWKKREDLTDNIIMKLLKKHGGNQAAVAKELECSVMTIKRRVKNKDKVKKVALQLKAIKDLTRKQKAKRLEESMLVVGLGIPLRDENNEIIGWDIRPDGQVGMKMLEKLGEELGYGKDPVSPDTNITLVLPDALKNALYIPKNGEKADGN